MASPIVEAFSISHAAILNGSVNAELASIYGVREGSVEIDSDSYSNTGDDTILSVWNWFNLATVSITSGFIPFDALSTITGATITSSGTAPNDYWNLPLWNSSSLNQPTRSVLLRCPSKTSVGVVRNLDFVLYKVQFGPISFDGPSYKNGLSISYSGQALMSTVDETGTALAQAAVGRLVSHV
jgi:hypothetical protein